MAISKVQIVEKIFDANDQLAMQNQASLDRAGVFAINMMASPGAGKTSVILETICHLQNELRIGVIEGDTAPVTIDADKVIATGVPAVQINTGGDCHLDANMIRDALKTLDLDHLDVLLVENVGNLICPAGFKLGTHANVLIASVPEGDDKPYKYPNIYHSLDVLIINKTDLLPYVKFDMDYFRRGVEILNPGLITFPLSCKTGQGFQEWIGWIRRKSKVFAIPSL